MSMIWSMTLYEYRICLGLTLVSECDILLGSSVDVMYAYAKLMVCQVTKFVQWDIAVVRVKIDVTMGMGPGSASSWHQHLAVY